MIVNFGLATGLDGRYKLDKHSNSSSTAAFDKPFPSPYQLVTYSWPTHSSITGTTLLNPTSYPLTLHELVILHQVYAESKTNAHTASSRANHSMYDNYQDDWLSYSEEFHGNSQCLWKNWQWCWSSITKRMKQSGNGELYHVQHVG